jgi:hypothetical protein
MKSQALVPLRVKVILCFQVLGLMRCDLGSQVGPVIATRPQQRRRNVTSGWLFK